MISIKKSGEFVGATSVVQVLRALAQDNAHRLAAAETALTNNSGGTAGVLTAVPTLVDEADDGTSLADGTEADAALDTVHNAVRELFTASGGIADAIGIDKITYNGGGAATDGTIAAVTVTVAAAATGALADETNATIDALQNALYHAAVEANRIANAVGLTEIEFGFSKTVTDTIAAITVDVGTPADPAVSKAALDAALVILRNNVKTVATKLIEAATAGTAKVVAV